ncbi:hypothetical protein B0H14DRAFT_3899593 [Mycena olivaceomarginata]|nr:hypothetical protein B0H14DRAFT_3899593 [Mycena olivaceomarginata]
MSTPPSTNVHPEDSPSPAREGEYDLPSPLGIAGTALFPIDELQELVVAETELVPPMKKTNSGASDVLIPAHILEQEARLNRALGNKITLRGVFGQGMNLFLTFGDLYEGLFLTDPQILCRSGLLALKPAKVKDGRVPKKKPTETLPSRPSGRENAVPTSVKRPWRV